MDQNHTHPQHHSHSIFALETNQERTDRIRKNKNIRKEKVQKRRNDILLASLEDKKQPTREQRKQMQKEKNRMAAQHSRDRQRKYLEDLQQKMQEMSKQLDQQLCRKCKASLSDHSTTEEQHRQESLNNESTTGLQAVQIQNNSQINLLNEEPQIQELPFYREDSRSDIEWGNIGRYFCIFLVVLSVALLSNSVETTSGQFSPVRPVARILTEKNEVCDMPQDKTSKVSMNAPPLTLEQAKLQDWPFKNKTGEPIQKCKNQFWEDYLKNINNVTSKELANPNDWNLVTCNSPNLVHISSVYEKSVKHVEDQWTFLITNPIVSQVLVQKTGGYHLDEVSYLDGVYQLTAQKVKLKKVLGASCIL